MGFPCFQKQGDANNDQPRKNYYNDEKKNVGRTQVRKMGKKVKGGRFKKGNAEKRED